MAVLFKIKPGDALIGREINPTFTITSAAIQAIKSREFNIPDSEVEEPVDQSDYDTPVLDNINFPAGKYIDLQDNEIDFAGITINTVLLEVSQPKNIIKTPIQGRNGTVKEYISDKDFIINARGIITNYNNVLPLDSLRAFRAVMGVPQQLEVVSQFLNEIFDINQIVVEEFNMPQIEGTRNQIPFTFKASSDVPLDVEELVVG